MITATGLKIKSTVGKVTPLTLAVTLSGEPFVYQCLFIRAIFQILQKQSNNELSFPEGVTGEAFICKKTDRNQSLALIHARASDFSSTSGNVSREYLFNQIRNCLTFG